MLRLPRLGLLPLLLSCTTTATASVPASPVQDEPTLDVVYERVRNSVVTVVTKGPSGLLDRSGAAVEAGGIGSGVLISDDGKIMTSAHVVQTAETVEVAFADGAKRVARILGTVPMADVALLQVDGGVPDGAVAAPLGDSEAARVGTRVFVIGAPRGITQTLTVGYLSAKRRLDPPMSDRPLDLLQTDTAINKGNSGGPLFDMRGEVIGIVSTIISASGGSEGIGFAVSSNDARALLLERNLLWSGVAAVFLQGPFASLFHLPDERSGMLVQTVAKGSMGARLGLRGGVIPATIAGQDLLLGGDVILEVAGIRVGDERFYDRIEEELGRISVGDAVQVLVLREGKKKMLGATFTRESAAE